MKMIVVAGVRYRLDDAQRLGLLPPPVAAADPLPAAAVVKAKVVRPKSKRGRKDD